MCEPIVDHLEADDMIGLAHDDTTCIVSIDKDFDCIAGWHYNFVKEILYYVEPRSAIYNFYHQLLCGDAADNIKGAAGIGVAKAKRILDGCETEEEFLEAVTPYFSCFEELDMNASCLWIQQKGKEVWHETSFSKEQRENTTEVSSESDSGQIPES